MCFGGSGSSKPPPPQAPTGFDYTNQSGDTAQRQAATYAAKGYTNRADFGSDLTSGNPAPAATPAAAVKPTSALSGGM